MAENDKVCERKWWHRDWRAILKIKDLVNEIDKPLTNLTKEKEEVTQSTIRNALRARTPKSYKNLRRMDAFLNAYHLSKLKTDDMSNLNWPITSNKIEALIKSPHTKEKPRITWNYCWIVPQFQGRSNSNSPQFVPQNRKGRNTTKFILQSYYYASIKDIKKRKENYIAISLRNIGAKLQIS